jgi:O-antigen/teichoic acid export membrane protein
VPTDEDAKALPAADVLDTPAAGPRALRGSLLRFGAYGGGTLLALVAQPLVARHLGRVGYGRYTLAIAIATIATGFTEGGVSVVALREYTSLSGSERENTLANMLGIRTVLNTVSVAGAVAFVLIAGYRGTVLVATALAACGLTLQITQAVVAVPLQGDLRFGWVAAADLLRQFTSTVLIVALVIAGTGVLPLVAVLVPANLAALALTRITVRGKMPRLPRFQLAVSLPLLRDTVPFAIAIALGVTYFRLSVVLVSLIGGANQLGIFSYSYRIVEVLIGLPPLVIGAAYPILARAASDDPERFAHATRRIFELAVVAAVWLAVCIELGARFGVDVIGGHAAAPSAAVLRIQGLAVIGTFVAASLAFPLLAVRGYRGTMYANAFGLLATVVVGVTLIPALGARGAAVGTVAGELALALANGVALFRARSGLEVQWVVIPVSAVAGAVSLAAGHLVGIHPLFEILVATVVYAVGLAALGRFPPEVAHALRLNRLR